MWMLALVGINGCVQLMSVSVNLANTVAAMLIMIERQAYHTNGACCIVVLGSTRRMLNGSRSALNGASSWLEDADVHMT
jgi:hypothetical protein